jgi:hypothetical protein
MESEEPGGTAALSWTDSGWPEARGKPAEDSAAAAVAALYQHHAAATGRVTVVNDLNILAGYQYEQVMYSNASGSVLVVSGARKGWTAGILRGDRYTPIPWDRHIATAIW